MRGRIAVARVRIDTSETVRCTTAAPARHAILRRSRVPLLLAIVGAALAAQPQLASAAGTGESISGRVTSASQPGGIKGIEVCAFEPTAEGSEGCAKTSGTGEYAITGLTPGSYDVEFANPFNGDLNYLRRYYNGGTGASEFSEALLVAVTASSEDNAIDAVMQEGGRIAGRVTSASTSGSIAEALVCAFGTAEADFESFACASSNASGEYTLVGLAGGPYTVFFEAPLDGSVGYAPQYYNDQQTEVAANPVHVTAGALTPGIDAALQEDGEISGCVTSASTGAALQGLRVCALTAAELAEECASTTASGEYTIGRLPAGSYRVGFSGAETPYKTQYYNNRTLFTEAQLLPVPLGSMVGGINAAMVLRASGVAVPPITTLTTPAAPTVIAPASGVLPSKTTVLPIAHLALKFSKIVVSGHSTSLRVQCLGSPCSGSAVLKAAHSSGALARGSFSIATGKSKLVVLHLTPLGRRRLAHAKRHPLAVKLALALHGGKPLSKSLLIS
jgi:hypothetical protein